jgi:hypothetical protein
MPKPTALQPPVTTPPPAPLPAAGHGERPGRELAGWLGEAAAAIAWLPLDDPRWPLVGPRLTAVVDAVRRAHGGDGSPIAAEEQVAPVLRLRDLARAAQGLAGMGEVGVDAGVLAGVAADVRWLQAMTGRVSRTP